MAMRPNRRPGVRGRQDESLFAEAEREVARARTALPAPVRSAAREVHVTFHDRPDPGHVEDGLDPDLLGLFLGSSLRESFEADPLPPQILLFVENLWDYAGGSMPVFRHEVRRTYLHELGHFLGLDEQDLADRNLD